MLVPLLMGTNVEQTVAQRAKKSFCFAFMAVTRASLNKRHYPQSTLMQAVHQNTFTGENSQQLIMQTKKRHASSRGKVHWVHSARDIWLICKIQSRSRMATQPESLRNPGSSSEVLHGVIGLHTCRPCILILACMFKTSWICTASTTIFKGGTAGKSQSICFSTLLPQASLVTFINPL